MKALTKLIGITLSTILGFSLACSANACGQGGPCQAGYRCCGESCLLATKTCPNSADKKKLDKKTLKAPEHEQFQ